MIPKGSPPKSVEDDITETWKESLSSESTIKLNKTESKFTNQIRTEETPLLMKSKTLLGSSKSNNETNLLGSVSRTASIDSIESQPSYIITVGKEILDFFLYGPKPMTKEELKVREWQWYDIFDVAANSKEIFIRHRESDLAVLDGIRALAYLWVLSDHVNQEKY